VCYLIKISGLEFGGGGAAAAASGVGWLPAAARFSHYFRGGQVTRRARAGGRPSGWLGGWVALQFVFLGEKVGFN